MQRQRVLSFLSIKKPVPACGWRRTNDARVMQDLLLCFSISCISGTDTWGARCQRGGHYSSRKSWYLSDTLQALDSGEEELGTEDGVFLRQTARQCSLQPKINPVAHLGIVFSYPGVTKDDWKLRGMNQGTLGQSDVKNTKCAASWLRSQNAESPTIGGKKKRKRNSREQIGNEVAVTRNDLSRIQMLPTCAFRETVCLVYRLGDADVVPRSHRHKRLTNHESNSAVNHDVSPHFHCIK